MLWQLDSLLWLSYRTVITLLNNHTKTEDKEDTIIMKINK